MKTFEHNRKVRGHLILLKWDMKLATRKSSRKKGKGKIVKKSYPINAFWGGVPIYPLPSPQPLIFPRVSTGIRGASRIEHPPHSIKSTKGHRQFQQQPVQSHFASGLMEADEFSYNLCSKAEKQVWGSKLQASLIGLSINVSTNYQCFWEMIICSFCGWFFFSSVKHFTKAN